MKSTSIDNRINILPTVALIGRPNVGKSTLFNYLIRTRDALVANFPRLTRDRKYGYAEISGRKFICIDTGGIDGAEKGLEKYVFKQSLLAMKESDIILFIVDAKAGLMPADIMIAKYLHYYGKLTLLVVNKTDDINYYYKIEEFWSLGLGNIYPIIASHGYGVDNLLKTALLPLFDNINVSSLMFNEEIKYWSQSELDNIHRKNHKNSLNIQDLPIKLAIVGRQNVGKSTLVNRILGRERVVVCDTPGTTRDSIYIPMQHGSYKYVLIDTAGVRRRSKITESVEKLSVMKTLQTIENSHVVILIINVHEEISNQDLSLLNFILNSGRSLVIAFNKCDSLSQEEKKRIKENLNFHLNFIDFVRVHFISALYGIGINDLFKSVYEAYYNATLHIKSKTLTNIATMAIAKHQLLVNGNHIKLKYAHIGGYNPLIIIIHGSRVKNLSKVYKRYLINYFRRSLKIVGTPIFIKFKESNN